MSVVLIGAPAAGKTRVGKRLAVRLGREFIDTDHTIAAAHGPIPAIFSEHGESYFRQIERAAVREALPKHAVVSLGGGAVLDPDTQGDLSGADVVLLTITAEAVEPRISNAKRPLIDGIETWKRLVENRRELYEALADFTIDTSSRPIDSVVESIAHWVEGQH